MHHRDTNHKFADEDFNNNYADDLNNKVPEENK